MTHPTYSQELQILLGEWLTYTALNRYNFEMAWNDDIPKNLSDAEMFETCPLYYNASTIYGYVSNFLNKLEIVTPKPKSGMDIANCKYSDISHRIHENIRHLNYIPPFIEIADYRGYFGESEQDIFSIDEKCRPMIIRLIDEGFCAKSGEDYSWTSKFRPYLESYNVWKSPEELIRIKASEASEASEESLLIARINTFVQDNETAKKVAETVFGANEVEFDLEKHMISETLEVPEMPSKTVFKWCGPKLG